jgi:cyclopropane-fatty-acyl-phospholipid synthase
VSLVTAAASAVEHIPLPDSVTRAGIALLVGGASRRLRHLDPSAQRAFAAGMAQYPIASHSDAANAQHYELPPEFFALILGPRRKYSCCLYKNGATTLAEAEESALAETALHARLEDRQRVLELGCGWGSLSLWLAERYLSSEIIAVSNSRAQRTYIEAEVARRGLRNLRVLTADMNTFEAGMRFDRVVSVEMFEHISNWPALLARVHNWLQPSGLLFLHVFSHLATPYRFDSEDKADWIARHFFTGGIMPSHGLIRELGVPFVVAADWRWNGTHYRRTAEHWLENYDANARPIGVILRQVYGNKATLWARRWRLFFLATAGLFGADFGTEWGISHYALQPR